ncbi:hypothetical protein BXZ70DRAFT_4442 [Cristinia sonorae]|uniref:Elongator complex protein 6 n=1 Tax=Cristinia sonorae TaxID=1940300 RepID=A0A8K0V0W9_9AGAR|nr:hypothetical protein BXZ70DRAFT_4442 [Cristinia sonorae]
MFPPASLPTPNELLLITDQLASPADFLLHRFVSSHLKQSKNPRCLIVSLSETLTRWKVLAGKANINLTHYISSGSVRMIDSRSLPQARPNGQGARLKPLYDLVFVELQSFAAESTGSLVVLDDVALLEWTGFSPEEITRFVRALFAACRKVSASLVIRHHITTPGDLEELTRSLLQLCTHHLEVLPLSSGRSGSVTGEVALHPGPGSAPHYKPVPRSAAVQYRLTDTSCIFFERGTGNNVL